MKLQKVGILAVTILTFNSQAMEKPCSSIDGLRNDRTSFYSRLPRELHGELYKFAMNDKKHHALQWALHKHAESVGFGAKHLKGHTQNVRGIALDTVNNRLISGSDDGVIKIWDLKTGRCQKTLHSLGLISCLAVANNKIILGSNDNAIKIWNPETEKCEKTLQGHTNWVSCLAFANNKIISGSWDTTIKIWNIEIEKCEKTLQGHTREILCFTSRNSKIISASFDNTIIIWDLETGNHEKVLRNPPHWISSFTVANNMVISGSWDASIKIWDLVKDAYGYSLKVPYCMVRHIDPVGCAYGADKSDIIILKLEDESIKKALHQSMDAANLLESAYNCSQSKQALDLRKNVWLYNAFTQLPIALQDVVEKEITVRLMPSGLGMRRA